MLPLQAFRLRFPLLLFTEPGAKAPALGTGVLVLGHTAQTQSKNIKDRAEKQLSAGAIGLRRGARGESHAGRRSRLGRRRRGVPGGPRWGLLGMSKEH